mmetsp:Transcript_26258/g.61028  ORF Transcript_26258/g.61028 Transcript_26258/m.61028 type:complete len:90 (-) Transcript_26258:717-986(-)
MTFCFVEAHPPGPSTTTTAEHNSADTNIETRHFAAGMILLADGSGSHNVARKESAFVYYPALPSSWGILWFHEESGTSASLGTENPDGK